MQHPTLPDVHAVVRDYFTGRGLGDNDDLIALGVLDSLALLDLLLYLETALQMDLLQDDLLPENFTTIGRIAEFAFAKVEAMIVRSNSVGEPLLRIVDDGE